MLFNANSSIAGRDTDVYRVQEGSNNAKSQLINSYDKQRLGLTPLFTSNQCNCKPVIAFATNCLDAGGGDAWLGG